MSPRVVFFIVCLAFLALAWRFYSFYQHLPAHYDGQKIHFIAVLHNEPKVRQGNQQFSLQTKDGLQVYITTRALPEFSEGDTLLIDGVFTKKENEGHIFWSVYYPNIQKLTSDDNIVSQNAIKIKKKAQILFYDTLSATDAGLLLGIIFGGNHNINDPFLEKLRTVGVLHVIAASGMNVSFVAGALFAMLSKVMRRQFALILGLVGIIFYTFITGFEPSIVRAAVMAILALSASLLGRQHIGIFALLVAGYSMLWWNPAFLFDVGFQLSFMATLGILLIKPLFLFKKNVFMEDFTTTLSAQAGTLPILLGTFGNVGIFSLLANTLILWTVPFLMTFGALAVALGFLFTPAGKLLLYITMPLLWFFEFMVNIFGSLDWMIQVESFSWAFTIGYYLLLFAVVLILQKRQKHAQEKRLGLES